MSWQNRSVSVVRRVAAAVTAGRLSAGVVLLVALTALVTFPGLVPGGAAVTLGLPPAFRLTAAVDLQVFCIDDDETVRRCGQARRAGDDRLLLTRYGIARGRDELIPVVAAADAMLLWALAGPERQDHIRDAAATLAREVDASLERLDHSPTWLRDYHDGTVAMLERARGRAWNAPETRRAFARFTAAARDLLEREFGHEAQPVVDEMMSRVMWQLARDNSLNVSLVIGGPLDTSAIGRAVSDAVVDPRIRSILDRLGARLLALPETSTVIETFVNRFLSAVREDREGTDLMIRLALDQRLGVEFSHVRDRAGAFVREALVSILGIGGAADLNPLAGTALKTSLLGLNQPIVLLLSATRIAELRSTQHDVVTPLFPPPPRT